MSQLLTPLRRLLIAFALIASIGGWSAALAQNQAPPTSGGGPASANIFEVEQQKDQAARQRTQPGNNAPVWQEVNSGDTHYSSLPAREAGVLIQKWGERWRQFRNGPVTLAGGWGLVLVLLAIAAFYLYRGPIEVSQPATGRLIERFTMVERVVHWLNAGCFVLLGLTGLTMLFGKHVVLPIFGHTLFSWLAIAAKTAHNFVGPLFAATIIAIFLTFVRDNFPRAYDLTWLRKGGGLLSGEHVPSARFNAGEKIVFWGGVVTLGIIVSVSGFVLDFPNFDQTRGQMQFAWVFHVVGALLFLAMIFGHIYIGTLGMEGALDAMRTGYVDEAWAKEHHEIWYEDIKAGKIPAQRSAAPDGPVAGVQQKA